MLTPAEQRVLEIFRDYTDREGQPPLLREIGQALGIRSKGSAPRGFGHGSRRNRSPAMRNYFTHLL